MNSWKSTLCHTYAICRAIGGRGGWGRYPHCRYPSFTFSVSNPIFGSISICTKYDTVTTRSLKGTWWYVIREPCTSNAVTDAYVQRSLDFFVFVFFWQWYKNLLLSWVSTPAPHVSLWGGFDQKAPENYRSLLQNIVSLVGLFCKRDL